MKATSSAASRNDAKSECSARVAARPQARKQNNEILICLKALLSRNLFQYSNLISEKTKRKKKEEEIISVQRLVVDQQPATASRTPASYANAYQ